MYLNILLYTITVTLLYTIPNKHSHNTASIIDLKQIYWMNINKRVKFKYDLIYKNYFPYQL